MRDRDNQTQSRRRVGLEPDGYMRSVAGGPGGGPEDRQHRDTRPNGFDLRVDPKDRSAGPTPGRTYGAQQRATASTAGARHDTARAPRSKTKELLSWILSIGLAVIAAFAIRGFLFEIILVDGESMEPTLHTNERLGIEKVTRYTSLPSRGDIIIVKYPNMDGTYVKRAIGLPGETVEVKDSTVYINGVPLDESYVSLEPYADMAPVVVPEDTVFVMGDNRAHSMDSRASYIGPIPTSDIIGHGLFVLWPFDSMHLIDHADFSGTAVDAS